MYDIILEKVDFLLDKTKKGVFWMFDWDVSTLMIPFAVLNGVGFFLFIVYRFLFVFGEGKWRETAAMIEIANFFVSLLGGATGVLTGIIFMERRTTKDNMFFHFTAFTMAVIYAVLFLFFSDLMDVYFRPHDIIEFFKECKVFDAYLILINLLTFVVFGIDKHRAIHGKMRVPDVTLLLLCGAFGWLGGAAGMVFFKHKIKKDDFIAVVTMMSWMDTSLMVLILNIFSRFWS